MFQTVLSTQGLLDLEVAYKIYNPVSLLSTKFYKHMRLLNQQLAKRQGGIASAAPIVFLRGAMDMLATEMTACS
jgi:hypothetical protein